MNDKKQYIKMYNSDLKENIYPHIQECPPGFSLLLRQLERNWLYHSVTKCRGWCGVMEAAGLVREGLP